MYTESSLLEEALCPFLLTDPCWRLVSRSQEKTGFTFPEMSIHSPSTVTFMVSSTCLPQLTRRPFCSFTRPVLFLTPGLLVSRKYHSEQVTGGAIPDLLGSQPGTNRQKDSTQTVVLQKPHKVPRNTCANDWVVSHKHGTTIPLTDSRNSQDPPSHIQLFFLFREGHLHWPHTWSVI